MAFVIKSYFLRQYAEIDIRIYSIWIVPWFHERRHLPQKCCGELLWTKRQMFWWGEFYICCHSPQIHTALSWPINSISPRFRSTHLWSSNPKLDGSWWLLSNFHRRSCVRSDPSNRLQDTELPSLKRAVIPERWCYLYEKFWLFGL